MIYKSGIKNLRKQCKKENCDVCETRFFKNKKYRYTLCSKCDSDLKLFINTGVSSKFKLVEGFTRSKIYSGDKFIMDFI